jgi:hypothetical protein
MVYINITIAVLVIVHRPVFYLKLNPTLKVCPYLAGNTLRLHYEPNRLMLLYRFMSMVYYITITILDIVHRPVILKHNVSQTESSLRNVVSLNKRQDYG